MKNVSRWMSLMAAVVGLTISANAQERERQRKDQQPGDRLGQLEQRINQVAMQQQQLMQRIGAALEQHGQAQQGHDGMRPPMGPQGPGGMRPPMDGPGGMQPPMPGHGPGPMQPQMSPGGPQCGPGAGCDHGGKCDHGGRPSHRRCPVIGILIACAIIINILIAVWIFGDIRKRNEGSGIFIALALIAGIPAAIIYALVRIGDRKP